MQQYRYILAIALTFAVILGWNQLSRHLGLVPEAPVETSVASGPSTAPVKEVVPTLTPANATTISNPADLQVSAPAGLPKGKRLTVKTPLYTAEFDATGGTLTSFTLSKYTQSLQDSSPFIMVNSQAALNAPMGLLLNESPTWKAGSWSTDSKDLDLAASQEGKLFFTWDYSGIKLVRELSFKANTYVIDEKIHLENTTPNALSFALGFTMSTPRLSGPAEKQNLTKVGYFTPNDKFKTQYNEDDLIAGFQDSAIKWGTIQSNFFIAAVMPTAESAYKAKLDNGVYRIALNGSPITLGSNAPVSLETKYYIGPKEKNDMALAGNDLQAAMDYGWFRIIAEPMLTFLTFLYGFFGNYGIAIIVLTIVIKTCMWPLSRKSYKSMERMKQLQPMIKKIQEKYADDKQKASAETMRLYKTYKVNPAGGCMPLLLQIPIFIGLYQGLLNAVELRHAPFITYLPFTDIYWLADLSVQDPFYITPIIMGATMFLQQKMSPPMGDPTQAKIMMFMPVVFTFLFCSFPAGLVLYWLVNSIFSIGQQWFTMRSKVKKADKPALQEDSPK